MIRIPRFVSRAAARASRKKRTFTLEHLEDRRLMTITSNFNSTSGLWTIGLADPDDADDIVVTAASNQALINGQTPGGGAISASAVKRIALTGGINTQLIDLSAVSTTTFPQMIETSIQFDIAGGQSMMLMGGGGDTGYFQFSSTEAIEESYEPIEPLPYPIQGPIEFNPIPQPEWTIEKFTEGQRFSALAEQLIGPDWPARLAISGNSSLTSSEIRRILRSDALRASLDPERVESFLIETVGADFASKLGISDVADFLEGSATLDLGVAEGLITQQLGEAAWVEVESRLTNYIEAAQGEYIAAARSGELTGLRGIAIQSELVVSIELQPNVSSADLLDAAVGQRFSAFLEAVLGAGWEQLLPQAALTDWRTALYSDELGAELTPSRVEAFLNHSFGDRWQALFGITDLADYLESGAWRRLFDSESAAFGMMLESEATSNGPLLEPGGMAMSLMSATPRLIKGSQFKDSITGTDDIDEIHGFGGNDVIHGKAGDDIIRGGSGNDDIKGEDGDDDIRGDYYYTDFFGAYGNDTLDGGTGNDEVDGCEGADVLVGGDGDDILIAGMSATDIGNDELQGGLGDDDLLGGYGIDLLDGGEGDDFLGNISGGGDVLDGAEGADEIVGSSFGETIDGGEGADTIDGREGDDIIDGGEGESGGALDGDHLTGGLGNDTIDGGEGDDQIFGNEGDDILLGGKHNDTIDGGSGNDVLEGEEGSDTLVGGSGDDRYVFKGSVLLGSDTVTEAASAGSDTLDFSDLVANEGIHVDLELDFQNVHALLNLALTQIAGVAHVENIIGGLGNDVLRGNSLPNSVEGRGGNDTLDGRGDIDRIVGGAGLDSPEIEDNADPDFSLEGSWSQEGTGFNGTQKWTSGAGSTATWNFPALPVGTYEVFVTWATRSGASTAAPFLVLDGQTSLGGGSVNQSLAPGGSVVADRPWHSLGAYAVSSGELLVRLASAVSGTVIADAVRIVRVGNQPPVITPISDAEIDEEQPLSFLATAAHPENLGAEILFSLASGAPAGATITPEGFFSWTPTENQGGATYPITIIATDSGSPSQSSSFTFNVAIAEVNSAPTIEPIEDQSAESTQLLTVALNASDSDSPTQTLTYALRSGAPAGAAVSSTGVFTWTPGADDAGRVFPILIDVTDNGAPALKATVSFIVTVAPNGDYPSIPVLTSGTDTGASQTDGVTKLETPTFTGTGPEGATIRIVNGLGASYGTGVVSNGVYSIASTVNINGTVYLTAQLLDSSNNVISEAPGYLTVVVDKLVPNAPGNLAIAASSQTGTATNVVNTTRPTFIGTAEPGTIVDLYEGSTKIGSGHVDVDDGVGRFLIPLDVDLAPGARVITAKVIDLAGNLQDTGSTISITIDVTAPTTPVVQLHPSDDTGSSTTDAITNRNRPVFTGTLEALGRAELYANGELVDFENASQSGGSYTLQPTSALADGEYSIVVKTIDRAGNVSVSAPKTVGVDTVKPEKPLPPDLDPSTDSGTLDDDNVTSTLSLLFVGQAEPGSKVEIFENSVSRANGIADASGHYSIPASIPAPWLVTTTEDFTVKVTDLAGNTSVATSDPLKVTIDRGQPSGGVLDLMEASDTGLSISDNITKDATPTFQLRNVSEPGGKVELYSGTTIVGEITFPTTITGSGAYFITSSALADGVHSLFARVFDLAGNSHDSQALSITVDTTIPSTPSAPDLKAASDDGSSDTDNITSLAILVFGGTAEAGTRLRLYADGKQIAESDVGGDGVYSVTGNFSNGTHVISAKSVDKAGNVSALSGTLTVVVNNQGFVVSVRGEPSVNEGDSITLDGAYSDPTFPDAHTYEWAIQSPGSSFYAIDGDASSPSFTFTPLDEGDYQVRLTVRRSNNATAVRTVVVKSQNVAPTLSNLTVMIDPVTGRATMTGTITDPGELDTQSLSVDWGTGERTVHTLPVGQFHVEHDYAGKQPPVGGFHVAAGVSDGDGGTASGVLTSISHFAWPDTPVAADVPPAEAPASTGPEGLNPPTFTGPAPDNSRATQTAIAAYNEAVQAAERRLEQTEDELENKRNREVEAARQRELQRQRSADAVYVQNQARANPFDSQAAQATFTQQWEALDAAYDADVAEALAEYNEAYYGASGTQQEIGIQRVQAGATYQRRLEQIALDFYPQHRSIWLAQQQVVDQHNAWSQQNQIDATRIRDRAYAEAARDKAISTADAERRYANALADATYQRDLQVAQAADRRDRAIATGLVAAANALAGIADAQWAAYQVTVATHAKAHADSVSAKRLEQATQDAESVRKEAKGIANEQRTLDHALAQATLDYLLETDAARAELERDQVARDLSLKTFNFAQQMLAENEYSEHRFDYNIAVIDADEESSIAWWTDEDPYNANAAEVRRENDLELAEKRLELGQLSSETMTGYEMAVQAEQAAAATDVADLIDVAEKRISAALADYKQKQRELRNEFRASETSIVADRLIEQANHAEAYSKNVAGPNKSRVVELASDEAAFKNSVMANYVATLTFWALSDGSAWSAHVVATMDAEADRVQDYGLASVAYATAQANANDLSARAEAAETRRYVVDQAKAVVQMKGELVTADDARNEALIDAEKELADAKTDERTTYDKAVIGANLVFANDLSLQWQNTRDAMLESWYDYEVANIESPGTVSQNHNDFLGEHTVHYRALMNAEATLRQSWIGTASDAKQERAENIADAMIDWAEEVDAENHTFAEQQADAVLQYDSRLATIEETLSVRLADQDRAWATRMLQPEQTRAHAEALADAQHLIRTSQNGEEFAATSANEYATLLDAWATLVGTPQARFAADVAASEATYRSDLIPLSAAAAQEKANALVARRDADASAQRGLTSSLNSAAYQLAVRTADAERGEAENVAGAERVRTVAVNQAESTRARATIVEDALKAKTDAATETVWAQENAEIYVDYVAAVAANMTVYNWHTTQGFGPYTTVNPQAYSQANADRDAQKRANDVERLGKLADSTILRAEHLGDADIALATSVGDAGIVYATQALVAAKQAAQMQKVASDGQQDWEITVRKYAQSSFALNEKNQVLRIQGADAAYEIAKAQAGAAYTNRVASDEAAYHLAQANLEVSTTDDAYASLGTPESLFAHQYAEAYRDWIVATTPEFTEQWSERALADVERATNNANAERTKADQAADIQLAYARQVANSEALRLAADAPLISAYTVALVDASGQRDLGVANADKTLMVETAQALKQYALDGLNADKTKVVSIANLTPSNTANQVFDDAMDAANVVFVTKQGDARVVWSREVATAEATLVKSQATADKGLAQQQATHKNEWVDRNANLIEARSENLLPLVMTALSTMAETESTWATKTVAANAEFVTDSHAKQTQILDQFNVQIGSDQSAYLAQRAHGLDSWTATLATAMAQRVAAANTSDATHNLTIRNSQQANSIIAASQNALKAKELAAAEFDYSFALAQSQYVYIVAAADAAANYEEAVAEGRRDQAIAKANGETLDDWGSVVHRQIMNDYELEVFTLTRDARESAIAAIFDYYETVSGEQGVVNSVETLLAQANILHLTYVNDARYQSRVDTAYDDFDFASTTIQGYAAALAALQGTATGPWAAAEAAAAQQFALARIDELEEARDDALNAASEQKTQDDLNAAADIDAQLELINGDQLAIFNAALQNHMAALDQIQAESLQISSGNFNPRFVPSIIESYPIVEGANAGRLIFDTSSGAVDPYFDNIGVYGWNRFGTGGWAGWASWGYFWGLSYWETPGANYYDPMGRYAYKPNHADYSRTFSAGFWGAANGMQTGSDQGSRDAAINATANESFFAPPGPPSTVEVTPGNIHFTEGLYSGNQTVSAQTMLSFRDQLFDQTDRTSFWSAPTAANFPEKGAFDGTLRVNRPTSTPDADFSAVIDAAFDQAGPGLDDTLEVASAAMPQGEAAAAGAPATEGFSLSLERQPASTIRSLIKDGKAFEFTRNISRHGDRTVVIIPDYRLADGEFLGNYLYEYQSGRNQEWYRFVGVDYTTTNPNNYKLLADVKYFDPMETGDLEATASALTFVLRLVPGGAASDQFQQGQYKEAAISLIGDLSLLALGVGKVAQGAVALNSSGAFARTAYHATKYAPALDLAAENAIGVYRAGQGMSSLADGEYVEAAGQFGEAFLRLAGVAPSTVLAIRQRSPLPVLRPIYIRGGDNAFFFDELARQGTHNSQSQVLVLGRTFEDGVSYISAATQMKATYFNLPDWADVTKGIATREDKWAINLAFLDQQVRQNKKILLSHDPNRALLQRQDTFFKLEMLYLRDLGYEFVKKGDMWEAIK